jgi:hypothetical protein
LSKDISNAHYVPSLLITEKKLCSIWQNSCLWRVLSSAQRHQVNGQLR